DMKEFLLNVGPTVEPVSVEDYDGIPVVVSSESEESECEEIFATDVATSDWEDLLPQTESKDENFEVWVQDLVDWAKTKLSRHGCTAHALQLVVRECLKKNPRATEILHYIQKLIVFFNSTYWNQRLKKLTKKSLIKMGDTRWNGFLLALQRILEEGFIANINQVLEEAKKGKTGKRRSTIPDMISPETEEDMIELASLLTPFLKLTNALQADEVTSSRVIPGLIGVYKEVAAQNPVKPYMKILRSSLCLTLVERFGAAQEFNPSKKGAKKHLLKQN
ncbi:unnamed protein product, partial [Allacma fusca]